MGPSSLSKLLNDSISKGQTDYINKYIKAAGNLDIKEENGISIVDNHSEFFKKYNEEKERANISFFEKISKENFQIVVAEKLSIYNKELFHAHLSESLS